MGRQKRDGSDTMTNSNTFKQCLKCKREFPATAEFFYIIKYQRKNKNRKQLPIPSDMSLSPEQKQILAEDVTDLFETISILSSWCKDCTKKASQNSYTNRQNKIKAIRAQKQSEVNTIYKLEQTVTTGQIPSGIEAKICRGCQSVKPADLTNFCKDKRMKDGLTSWCRRCIYDYNTNRRKIDIAKTRINGYNEDDK
jgi:hypothetical protein